MEKIYILVMMIFVISTHYFPQEEPKLTESTDNIVSQEFSEAQKFTEEEIMLMAKVVQAEACGEDEKGKRLIVSVILNRAEYYGMTVSEVIYSPNQFVIANWYSAECENAVRKEVQEKTNTEVLYFRAGKYHDFGTPLFQHGNHYFSGN